MAKATSSSRGAGAGAEECSVCLSRMDSKNSGEVVLICGHRFHVSCIGCVFNEANLMKCPVCRGVEFSSWTNDPDTAVRRAGPPAKLSKGQKADMVAQGLCILCSDELMCGGDLQGDSARNAANNDWAAGRQLRAGSLSSVMPSSSSSSPSTGGRRAEGYRTFSEGNATTLRAAAAEAVRSGGRTRATATLSCGHSFHFCCLGNFTTALGHRNRTVRCPHCGHRERRGSWIYVQRPEGDRTHLDGRDLMASEDSDDELTSLLPNAAPDDGSDGSGGSGGGGGGVRAAVRWCGRMGVCWRVYWRAWWRSWTGKVRGEWRPPRVLGATLLLLVAASMFWTAHTGGDGDSSGDGGGVPPVFVYSWVALAWAVLYVTAGVLPQLLVPALGMPACALLLGALGGVRLWRRVYVLSPLEVLADGACVLFCLVSFAAYVLINLEEPWASLRLTSARRVYFSRRRRDLDPATA